MSTLPSDNIAPATSSVLSGLDMAISIRLFVCQQPGVGVKKRDFDFSIDFFKSNSEFHFK